MLIPAGHSPRLNKVLGWGANEDIKDETSHTPQTESHSYPPWTAKSGHVASFRTQEKAPRRTNYRVCCVKPTAPHQPSNFRHISKFTQSEWRKPSQFRPTGLGRQAPQARSLRIASAAYGRRVLCLAVLSGEVLLLLHGWRRRVGFEEGRFRSSLKTRGFCWLEKIRHRHHPETTRCRAHLVFWPMAFAIFCPIDSACKLTWEAGGNEPLQKHHYSHGRPVGREFSAYYRPPGGIFEHFP